MSSCASIWLVPNRSFRNVKIPVDEFVRVPPETARSACPDSALPLESNVMSPSLVRKPVEVSLDAEPPVSKKTSPFDVLTKSPVVMSALEPSNCPSFENAVAIVTVASVAVRSLSDSAAMLPPVSWTFRPSRSVAVPDIVRSLASEIVPPSVVNPSTVIPPFPRMSTLLPLTVRSWVSWIESVPPKPLPVIVMSPS